MKADADIIAGGLLLEIKTNLGGKRSDGSRSAGLETSTLRQLLGYTLLDFADEFAIEEVGLYAARYGHLTTWPLPDLLQKVAGRRVDLAAERAAFYDARYRFMTFDTTNERANAVPGVRDREPDKMQRAVYQRPANHLRLSVEPQLASWDRAGHPSQVRLAGFLAHVDTIAAPVLAGTKGRLSVELVVGLPVSASLSDGGRDLDNCSVARSTGRPRWR